MASLTQLQALPQYLVPQHFLSRVIGLLVKINNEKIKNWAIDHFIRRYGVDMRDAVEPNPHRYADFNSFFTRRLRPETRPIVPGDLTIACPADGIVSEFGHIQDTILLQAKKHEYSLVELLGD